MSTTGLSREQIAALVAEMNALAAEAERINARLAVVTGLILASARWRGGQYGEWVPIGEYPNAEAS